MAKTVRIFRCNLSTFAMLIRKKLLKNNAEKFIKVELDLA